MVSLGAAPGILLQDFLLCLLPPPAPFPTWYHPDEHHWSVKCALPGSGSQSLLVATAASCNRLCLSGPGRVALGASVRAFAGRACPSKKATS